MEGLSILRSLGALTAPVLLAVTCLPAQAQEVAEPAATPIVIERQGSFSAGGTVAFGDDGQQTSCDHGYVEYQIPANARRVPLFFWHSSSTAAFANRWDGGEGFQSLFLRRGYPVYLWDGPRVGRANWGCEDEDSQFVAGRDQQNFTSWRLGAQWMQFFPGVQFPVHDSAAFDQAMRGRYNEFDRLDNARLEAGAAVSAVARIGPVIAVTSSAGGLRALLAASQSDNVAAIVAYENPGYLFPEGAGPPGPDGPFGPVHVSEEAFARLLKVPMQFVWGDNIAASPVWTAKLEECRQFVAQVNARGGHAEILMLTDAGLTGNTHMPFTDLNNVHVAALLDDFLARHGLDER